MTTVWRGVKALVLKGISLCQRGDAHGGKFVLGIAADLRGRIVTKVITYILAEFGIGDDRTRSARGAMARRT